MVISRVAASANLGAVPRKGLGALLGCLAMLGFGCQGQIEPGSASEAPGAAGDTGQPGSAGAGPGVVAGEPGDPRLMQRVWRLTPEQINREVETLFGAGAPAISLPDSAAEDGITNIAANGVVDLGNASLLADGVRAIGSWVAAQGETTTRCSDYGSDACVDSFLGWFVPQAYRRPVSNAERAELRALFEALRSDYDYAYALSGVVRAVLLSPEFLYRIEIGPANGGTLEPYEIANLMAFAITDAGPDAELLEAAEAGELATADGREVQARRLMASSERSWQRFFWEWLQMATLYSQGAEVGLDDSLVAMMEEEYRAFVREVVVNERGTLRDLLSAPYTWAQPELARHYGASHPGGGLARVTLDPEQRGGLFTQGAWLVSHGKRGRDNVVRRGMNIYKQAMCNNDLSPPAGLDVQAELAKLVGPDATVRETVEARGEAPTCGGCHRVADPVGLVFESFASDGTFQEVYPDGRAVDTAIELEGVGAFDSARAFSAALADDYRFQRCFVRRFGHFVLGIDLGHPDNVEWTQQAHEAFLAADTSLEELLVALVRHPAFVEREVGP